MPTPPVDFVPRNDAAAWPWRVLLIVVGLPISLLALLARGVRWVGEEGDYHLTHLRSLWRRRVALWAGLTEDGRGRSEVLAKIEKRERTLASLRESREIMRAEREASGLPPLIPELTEESGTFTMLPPYGSPESLEYGSTES